MWNVEVLDVARYSSQLLCHRSYGLVSRRVCVAARVSASMRLLVGMDGRTAPGEGSMQIHTVVR